ncbi:MAG: HEAT repeat domain-containing protein, partial [Candidatus Hydrogenedentes bacterium]|nr:HEAT repeat domain-containing protein [Candidatus Hydrogenedentota bacterium]
TQYVAIEALAKLKDKRAADVFLAALSSSYDMIRIRAAEGLAANGETRAVPMLIDAMQKHPEKGEPRIYLNSLAALGDRSAVPAVCAVLADHQDFDEREAAASALGQLGGEQARDALLAALRTQAIPTVRGAAAAALGVLEDPAAIAPLSDALRFDGEPVQAEAAQAIVRIGTSEAFAALLAAYPSFGRVVEGDTLTAARIIIDALGASDSPRALDIVFELLRDNRIPDQKLQLQAALALADKKDSRAAEFLNKLRGNPETHVDSERALLETQGQLPETPAQTAAP